MIHDYKSNMYILSPTILRQFLRGTLGSMVSTRIILWLSTQMTFFLRVKGDLVVSPRALKLYKAATIGLEHSPPLPESYCYSYQRGYFLVS